MGQVLHECATTAAVVRRAIQHSQKSLKDLVEQYAINPKTVAKWRSRTHALDAPMEPKEVRSNMTAKRQALPTSSRTSETTKYGSQRSRSYACPKRRSKTRWLSLKACLQVWGKCS